MSVEKVIIIGSGPAGYTAAIYAARADMNPLLFEGQRLGGQPGGQLMLTTEVENFPGFPEGLTGSAMMEKFKKQAQRFGTRVISEDVIETKLSDRQTKRANNYVRSDIIVPSECSRYSSSEARQYRTKSVVAQSGTYEAKTVIIATGAQAMWIGAPGEETYQGHGVSACATCDGFFFKDKEILVVGGGDAAMEESNFLTKFAKKVTVIHRRDALRASKIMQERVMKNPKIDFLWNTEVREVLGDGTKLTGVRIFNNQTNQESELATEGLFVAIGHKPNTSLFEGQLDLDVKGYIVTKPGSTATSVEGVFAGGDVADHKYRQAITAAGTGCMAALDAERWLEAQE